MEWNLMEPAAEYGLIAKETGCLFAKKIIAKKKLLNANKIKGIEQSKQITIECL